MEKRTGTHVRAEYVGVLAVVRDEDEAAHGAGRVGFSSSLRTCLKEGCLRIGRLREHLFTQMASSASLDAVEVVVNPAIVHPGVSALLRGKPRTS